MPAELKTLAEATIGKAIERLLADEKRARRVASLVGAVQRAKAAINQAQMSLLRSLSIIPRKEYLEVGKRVSAANRRARHLAQRLDRLDAGKGPRVGGLP